MKNIFGGGDDRARAKKKKFPVFVEIIIIGVLSSMFSAPDYWLDAMSMDVGEEADGAGFVRGVWEVGICYVAVRNLKKFLRPGLLGLGNVGAGCEAVVGELRYSGPRRYISHSSGCQDILSGWSTTFDNKK